MRDERIARTGEEARLKKQALDPRDSVPIVFPCSSIDQYMWRRARCACGKKMLCGFGLTARTLVVHLHRLIACAFVVNAETSPGFGHRRQCRGNMCIDLETPDRLSRKAHASCSLATLARGTVELDQRVSV